MYEEQLKSLGLFSPKWIRLRVDLTVAYGILSRGSGRTDADLLTQATRDRTQGNGMELQQRLDIRKRFFTQGRMGKGNLHSMELARVHKHPDSAFKRMI